MAKTSIINRGLRRLKLVKKYAGVRARLAAQVKDTTLSEETRQQARVKLHMLPRDSSPVRLRSRCRATGRPRGFYRKFGLSRNKLRLAAMNGDVPGLVKASW